MHNAPKFVKVPALERLRISMLFERNLYLENVLILMYIERFVSMNDKTRNYRMDNCKTFLIFLVVFAHLLECFVGGVRLWIYFVIYSFHMPAFVYITGYFSKFNPECLIKRTVYSYFMYQFFYLMFQRYILQEENQMQFTQPYWLLWYLFSMSCWILLLPVIDWSGFQKKRILAGTLICALLVGSDFSVGYYFSLSRTVVLFPFFALGHYRSLDKFLFLKKKQRLMIVFGCTVAIIISIYAIKYNLTDIRGNWFYHSLAYTASASSVLIRFAILGTAFLWCVMLMLFMPDVRIPLVTNIGKYTLPIFLLHGFLIKWLAKIQFFKWGEAENIVAALILALLICGCLGNEHVMRGFKRTFMYDWKK